MRPWPPSPQTSFRLQSCSGNTATVAAGSNVSLTRAVYGAALKSFLVTDFVGYNIHARPLAEQFESLAGTPGTADEPLVEEAPQTSVA